GQLGPDALTSRAMHDTLALCVSCKACRRECPTGVDMARMKIEVLHHYHASVRRPLRDLLVAHLPRIAPWAAKAPMLANARDSIPGVPWLGEKMLGFARARSLPRWHRRPFAAAEVQGHGSGPEVVLLPDTFNTYFEPENLRAACRVLTAGGYRVRVAAATGDSRPLCCGRTYLATGMIEHAKVEAERCLQGLAGALERGTPIVGLEPSCVLGLR